MRSSIPPGGQDPRSRHVSSHSAQKTGSIARQKGRFEQISQFASDIMESSNTATRTFLSRKSQGLPKSTEQTLSRKELQSVAKDTGRSAHSVLKNGGFKGQLKAMKHGR